MKKISTSQISLTTRKHFPSLWPDNWNMDFKNRTGSTLQANKAAGPPHLCFTFQTPLVGLSSVLLSPLTLVFQLKHQS